MKKFFHLIKEYVLPYKRLVGLNVSFNLLQILFSLFSIGMIVPFLGILFGKVQQTQAPSHFDFSITTLLQHGYYYLNLIILENGKNTALFIVSGFVVTMILFKNLFIYLANYHITAMRNGIVQDIRNKIYRKTLELPLSYYSNERKGDIIARMTSDVQEVEWSILNSLEMIFKEPLTIIFYVLTLFFMSVELSIFVLILLPISGLIIGRLGKKLRKVSGRVQQKMGVLLSIIDETLSGLRIIRAFNAEQKMWQRFRNANKIYTILMNKAHRRRYLASPVSEFLGVLVLIIVMCYGGNLVLLEKSNLPPEAFIGYIAIFSQIINPAKSFSSAYYAMQKGLASIDRINLILEAKNDILEIENPVSVSEFRESIEFKNVSFKYSEEYVLKNISFKIEKGKTVALVGQSGSGKSTLVDLLPRFFDVTEGEILIDGIPIKNYKIQDLRNLMGNVNQECILFNDSIFNNIAFGVRNPSQEEIISAAKVANANDFIMEMKNKYQSNIGDRGTKLSGGQRQRISIARAVLKNPPILILDEATSALDTESEYLVQDALMKLLKNRTSIVIAHRLSTIRHADIIYVLHGGKIVESGNHEGLMQKNGIYRKLNDIQTI